MASSATAHVEAGDDERTRLMRFQGPSGRYLIESGRCRLPGRGVQRDKRAQRQSRSAVRCAAAPRDRRTN